MSASEAVHMYVSVRSAIKKVKARIQFVQSLPHPYSIVKEEACRASRNELLLSSHCCGIADEYVKDYQPSYFFESFAFHLHKANFLMP